MLILTHTHTHVAAPPYVREAPLGEKGEKTTGEMEPHFPPYPHLSVTLSSSHTLRQMRDGYRWGGMEGKGKGKWGGGSSSLKVA